MFQFHQNYYNKKENKDNSNRNRTKNARQKNKGSQAKQYKIKFRFPTHIFRLTLAFFSWPKTNRTAKLHLPPFPRTIPLAFVGILLLLLASSKRASNGVRKVVHIYLVFRVAALLFHHRRHNAIGKNTAANSNDCSDICQTLFEFQSLTIVFRIFHERNKKPKINMNYLAGPNQQHFLPLAEWKIF